MFEGQTDFETTLGKRKIDHMPMLCNECPSCKKIQLISTNLIPPRDCWTGTSVFSVFSMSTCGRQSLQSLPPRNQSLKQPEHIH
ncbi:uncharacterized protein AFUA_7G07020 [Aspergillus fumigatus Af293]|uniref:Uncharacterized protein n=1 Tax=Aspergillus fumigatus (strain ATCC MYA-4609 / CBS 101355 / FGSC A1100 / Af293) TaxID=330879 RepID=Q4WH20_ASPFU|nr:hypothetical protein AFUA_7G07020 [Aspergillus fumigatus Af293]EAL86771.1 hypothetical protein AFUA_7G07020 [Aspergillus fumigatus Af293]